MLLGRLSDARCGCLARQVLFVKINTQNTPPQRAININVRWWCVPMHVLTIGNGFCSPMRRSKQKSIWIPILRLRAVFRNI